MSNQATCVSNSDPFTPDKSTMLALRTTVRSGAKLTLSTSTPLYTCTNRYTYLTTRGYASNPTFMSTISAAIKGDHRDLETYYNEVVGSSDPDYQQRYGNQFVWELARHSVAEELVVYPAMEKYLGQKGKDLADHDRQEHHEVCHRPDHSDAKLSICLPVRR